VRKNREMRASESVNARKGDDESDVGTGGGDDGWENLWMLFSSRTHVIRVMLKPR